MTTTETTALVSTTTAGQPAPQKVATTIEAPAGDVQGHRRPGASARRRFVRRLSALMATLGAVLGLALVGASSASATITTPDKFYAECSPSSMTAYSPDMRYWPNYGVSWNAALYVYTSAGWSRYGTSATRTAYGQNLLPAFSVWQEQQSATWYSLPRGRYYQVRVTAGWFGASSWLVNGATVHHQIAQANFNLTQYNYSTSTYCYMP